MKKMNKENITMIICEVVAILLAVAAVIVAIYTIYNIINGCPVCGAHEWIKGQEHIHFINGIVSRTHEIVCGVCGNTL